MVALIILAVLTLVVGALFLTQATLGIGFIAIACLLAILARIAQAASYQAEARERRKTAAAAASSSA
jgi:hypothetical protein